jgi:hypothetical protein
MRDTLNMADHGAVATLSFVDLGLPSTAGMADVAPQAKRLVRWVETQAGTELDLVVAEAGDGIIGAYGVESILRDAEFMSSVRAHVLCANDLVAAWAGPVAGQAQAGGRRHRRPGHRQRRRRPLHHRRDEAARRRTRAPTPEGFVDIVEKAAFQGATA